MQNETNKLAVAQTILAQLGGGRFIAMTGATNFEGDAHSLTFKLPRNASGVTHVRIVLEPSDEYAVAFLKVRGTQPVKTVRAFERVQASQLREVFTMTTGLDVSR